MANYFSLVCVPDTLALDTGLSEHILPQWKVGYHGNVSTVTLTTASKESDCLVICGYFFECKIWLVPSCFPTDIDK